MDTRQNVQISDRGGRWDRKDRMSNNDRDNERRHGENNN